MGALDMSSRWGFARLVTTVLAGLALLQAAPPAAQSSGVEFTVSGTSTIRGWTCSASGSAEVTPGAAEPVPGFDTGVQTATLTVPVNGFDCPEEEMREHLLEALRADEFDEITFRLESYEVSGRQAQATGSLTILDATEPVTFPISLSPSGAGVEIEGELRLDMTTYGVEPPVVMLGLLRVRPQIRIEFTGLLAP
ncbi:MAG: YceI family protein [Vicinamibacterales bacterium]|nr:YceI family protein [Vicinamibacterales bacterium]